MEPPQNLEDPTKLFTGFFVKMKKEKSEREEKLLKMRHSCEHVLTQAMLKLFPGIKMAIGPATEEGFYFDFDPGKYQGKISEKDFPKIEKEMAKIIKANLPIKKEEISLKEARKLFKDNPYKQEWLDEIALRQAQGKKEKAVIYWTGKEFVDLCLGPHLKQTGKIGPFKLLSIAGAYWRGDEKRKMLTRIYGTCFPTKKELDQYLWQVSEAKKRDHRLLGQKLELFMFDDEVGQGLPLWLPKGAFVRHKIMEFAFNTYLEHGYKPVFTPHIASESLWQRSGHLDFYSDFIYKAFGIEKEKYRLKPMNCPFHLKMYKLRPRSYKELPLRWTEMGTVYRYEKSGVLHGLTRVRGFTQDDAHIVCRPDQLHQELIEALKLTLYILKTFGFKDLEMNLSVKDPKNKDKFIGSKKGWQQAEAALKKALISIGYKDFALDIGGAVFYGPKIDVKIADSLGRKWQLSTIQVDFNLPARFEMKYIDKDGKEKVPFMIHRALLGSLERFMGVFIEHCAGAFPVWLAPVQAVIVPISDRFINHAKLIKEALSKQKIRVEVDGRNETMEAKIRDATLQKVPFMLIIGEKEIKISNFHLSRKIGVSGGKLISNEQLSKIFVSARTREGKDLGQKSLKEFLNHIQEKIEKRA